MGGGGGEGDESIRGGPPSKRSRHADMSTRDVSRGGRTERREVGREARGKDRWEALKRQVRQVASLDGEVLHLRDGIVVVHVDRVVAPEQVVKEACAHGRLDRATLARCVRMKHAPVLVTRELLATARRDLRALGTREALAIVRDRRRALARFGEIDEAWIRERSARVEALAAELGETGGTRTGLVTRPARASAGAANGTKAAAAAGWFDAVLELVAATHGEDAARRLDDARVRLTGLPAERRKKATERLGALLAALDGIGPEGGDAELAPLVARLDDARDRPGRARRSRTLDVLRRVLRWPEAPADAAREIAEGAASGEGFASAVRAAGTAMIRALPAVHDPDERERVLDVLAYHGLAFRTGDDGVPWSTREDVIAAFQRQTKDELTELLGIRLTVADADRLASLPIRKWHRKTIARWVAEGLDLDLVKATCDIGKVETLAQAGGVDAARSYATWIARLVPHYEAMGIELDLPTDMFARLPRHADLAVLSLCLMDQAHPRGRKERKKDEPAPDPIAALDATLGLFDKLPQKASGLLERLRGTTPGAGRAALPEIAAWLGDDELLDRLVHLSRLARLPTALTRQLREDFDHEDKVARERSHLLSLPSRSPRQEARLATLGRSEGSRDASPLGPTPGGRPPVKRTKRRLRERIDELLPIAFRLELDDVFREIVRDGWGIDVPTLTEAWRDAVRFWLVVDDNRDLLRRLLREASRAPGEDVKLRFPKNVEWLAAQGSRGEHLDAWTQPRQAELEIGGATFTIALEQDPLEVLRMGIPFGTCLALDTGCNAASTVLNAVDVNKRVVYVRNREGKIVARKLLAIDPKGGMLGYRLYVSTGGAGEIAIQRAVYAFCRDLARDAGLSLANQGEPAAVHQGFWYDDGTVAWGDDGDVSAYCASLGLSPPAKPFDELGAEARVSSSVAPAITPSSWASSSATSPRRARASTACSARSR